jgi:2-iminobutanoate/2-iminopropanoate deaminase
MRREIITTDRIAPSVGPFSAAVRAGDLLFLSGQVALDPATGKLVAGDIGAQTEQIFANISAVLEAAGKSFDDVMKTTVYLADMKDFADEHGLRALFPDTISGPDNDSGRRAAARRRRRDRGRGEIGASDAERAKPARTFDALKSLGRLGASIFGARLNRDPVSGGGVAFAGADVRLRAQHR